LNLKRLDCRFRLRSLCHPIIHLIVTDVEARSLAQSNLLAGRGVVTALNMTLEQAIENLNILLVDDESFVRKLNAHVLSGLTQQNVFESDSARNAITILNKQPINLLITDIQMPEMNGLELMKEIRCGRTSAPTALPILVITSYSNTEVLGSSMGLDVNGFLVKPISPKNALEKINIAIHERIAPRSIMTYERVMTDLSSLSGGASQVKTTEYPGSISIPNSPTGIESEAKVKIIKVSLAELKPGMKLVSELHSRDGVTLLASGQLLTEQMVNRIIELESLIGEKEVLVEL
jgi:CheY-like chemotaxis protein